MAATAAFLLPGTARADINATVTLSAGESLDMDNGTTNTAGSGDITFTGTAINFVGKAAGALIPGTLAAGETGFNEITAALLAAGAGQASSTPIPASMLTAGMTSGSLIGLGTNGGNAAKILVLTLSSTSLGIQYTTYGGVAAGGGGTAPAVATGGVVNAASFSTTTPVTPGSLFTIFGSNLASSTASADSVPLSVAALGGATVQFIQGNNTYQAPLLFAQPTTSTITSQINAQVPWELDPTQAAQVTVTVGGTASAPASITLGSSGPGIFASNGNAIVVNPDGTLAWAPGTLAGLTTHGVTVGQTVLVYATGLGAVTPSHPADGANSLDQLRTTTATPIVTIGGVQATVSFSGLSPQFVGVYQLNVVVPNVAAGTSVPIQIQLGNITTANNTVIAVTN